MLVKEILKMSATFINREDLLAFYSDEKVKDYINVKRGADLLLRCYNLTASEIAGEYFKLKKTETFGDINGVLSFSRFTYNPLSIVSVVSENGNYIKSKIKPTEILVNEDKVTVEYTYEPPFRMENDISDYENTAISGRILALGTASEFCLISGMFEEALTWQNAFKDSLNATLSTKKNLRLKGRRWY